MRNVKRSSLPDLAHAFFPAELLDDSSSACSELGKRFSIAKSQQDSIVRCELKGWSDKPRGHKSCDCVFLCSSPDQPTFALVLVELKGKRVDTALEQLEATFRLLCKKHEPQLPVIGHGKVLAGSLAPRHANHAHSLYHLGIIVAPGGGREFDRRQKERARLLNEYSLKVLLVSKPHAGMRLDKIFKESNSKSS